MPKTKTSKLIDDLRSLKINSERERDLYRYEIRKKEKRVVHRDSDIMFDKYLEDVRDALFSDKDYNLFTSPLECDTVYLSNKYNPKIYRDVPQKPYKILAADGVVDDFYCHVIDWMIPNYVVLCIENAVNIRSMNEDDFARDIPVFKPTDIESELITVFTSDKQNIGKAFVGTGSGLIVMLDFNKEMTECSMEKGQNTSRIYSMKFRNNTLLYGDFHGYLDIVDVREDRNNSRTINASDGAICSIEWRDDHTFAMGTNDNFVKLWDLRRLDAPFYQDQRDAGIRALAFNPTNTSILATGGGTADRKLVFYDTSTLSRHNTIDTKSQIGGIKWSPCGRELVSIHGYCHNCICVWNYSDMSKITQINHAHGARVLQLAQSPNGYDIATSAGDDTVKLWHIFESKKQKKKNERSKWGEMMYWMR